MTTKVPTVLELTVTYLKELVQTKELVDVGRASASALVIPQSKIIRAVHILEEEGYRVFYIHRKQEHSNLQTTIKVLAGSDMTFAEVMKRRGEIFGIGSDIVTRQIKNEPSEDHTRGTITVQEGPSRSGKTVRARVWEADSPKTRRVVDDGDQKEAELLADQGYDVYLNILT